jgi:hypothetical protein
MIDPENNKKWLTSQWKLPSKTKGVILGDRQFSQRARIKQEGGVLRQVKESHQTRGQSLTTIFRRDHEVGQSHAKDVLQDTKHQQDSPHLRAICQLINRSRSYSIRYHPIAPSNKLLKLKMCPYPTLKATRLYQGEPLHSKRLM